MRIRGRRFAIVFGGAVIIAVVALGGMGFFFIQRGFNDGFSARGEPSAMEAFIARRVRGLSMPRGARDAKNPLQASPEVLSRAMAHFADHCATCHGNDGRGKTLIGKGLYPKPVDLANAGTQQRTDGELFFVIRNGIRLTGMPAFGRDTDDEADAEGWALVHFIRHLPGITPGELSKMKDMNPKSPMAVAREERLRKFLRGDDGQSAEDDHKHKH